MVQLLWGILAPVCRYFLTLLQVFHIYSSAIKLLAVSHDSGMDQRLTERFEDVRIRLHLGFGQYLLRWGAGFIGSNLVDNLIKHHNIIVVDDFDKYYDTKIKEQNIAHHITQDNYKLYNVDITDKQALAEVFANKIDAVIHLAGKAGVRPSLEDPFAYYNTNIIGTLNILEQMKANNIKKLVFASSSSVYGNSTADKFHEELKLNEPISPYAATKLAGEHLCYTYSKLYNINICCLRFFTVYGPRQRPDLAINKFVSLISNNKPIEVYGKGDTKRDYTFVEDIVFGIIAALNYQKTSYEVFNLGGGEPINLLDMISIIEESLDKKAIKEFLPMQPGDVNKTVCDYSKAKNLLGYEPKTSFKQGIAKFIEWKNKSSF